MSSESFELVYDGTETKTGEMDVYALAPALLAVGDLFRDADRALNGQDMIVTTSVRANFKAGSFEILLKVEQHLRDSAPAVFPALQVSGADRLLEAVLGELWDKTKDTAAEKAPEIVRGLFSLLGKLGGKKPEDVRRTADNKTSIFVLGNNNQITVDQRTADLYEDPTTLNSAVRVASPLNRDGIAHLRAKKGSREIARLKRTDVPQVTEALSLLHTPMQALPEVPPPSQELIVSLTKPNFAEGKWSVSDGGRTFSVTMDDEDFRARVHAREVGFFDGDLYRVEMVTSQVIRGKRVTTTRSIARVIAPVNTESQQLLALSEQQNQNTEKKPT